MNLTPYLSTLRAREGQLRESRQRRALLVRDRLPEVARRLVEEFGVRRVVVFGSLLEGELCEDSDLDLAVEGLDPAAYFRAIDRAAEAAGISVDLVPLEEAGTSLRRRIEEEGMVLRE